MTLITAGSFMGALSPILRMDRNSVKDLIQVRVHIEGAVASLAAERMTAQGVQELESLLAPQLFLILISKFQGE